MDVKTIVAKARLLNQDFLKLLGLTRNVIRLFLKVNYNHNIVLQAE